MRERFHEELHELLNRVFELARSIAGTAEDANTAVLSTDIEAAQRAISSGARFEQIHAEIDDRPIDLIVRQQPVATDLRTIIAVIRMSPDL